jgi:hypothetical protein
LGYIARPGLKKIKLTKLKKKWSYQYRVRKACVLRINRQYSSRTD